MQRNPYIYIILSASLFGLSPPLAKLLVKKVPPVPLAGLLYLGAFAGLTLYSLFMTVKKNAPQEKHAPLEKKDIPWLAGAVVLGGIAGPISLMTGLTYISGFSASLLLNLEGLVTALIAVVLFRENTGNRLWWAIGCMTMAGIILSWDPNQGRFNLQGPLLILLAMICWGLDNNLTCKISDKDPIQITRIKGLVAGTASLAAALVLGMHIPWSINLLWALLLGSFSYGLSLVLFIQALKGLGSSRTGAFFSFAPFVGAIASVIILGEWLGWIMAPAAALMFIGVWLLWGEKHSHVHFHPRRTHTHAHLHDNGHHLHRHRSKVLEPHAHEHTHDILEHMHVHWPDTHHRHEH